MKHISENYNTFTCRTRKYHSKFKLVTKYSYKSKSKYKINSPLE